MYRVFVLSVDYCIFGEPNCELLMEYTSLCKIHKVVIISYIYIITRTNEQYNFLILSEKCTMRNNQLINIIYYTKLMFSISNKYLFNII